MSNGTGIRISRVGPNPYQEDEKKPARPILIVEPTDRKDLFLIKVLHPNKSWFFPEVKKILREHGAWNPENRKLIVRRQSLQDIEELPSKIKRKYNKPEKFLKTELTNDILYSKKHRFTGFEDPMEGFNQAIEKGNEILDTKFKDLVTEYEDIKHIPHYKKGFVKLNTKKDHKDD